MRVIPMMAVVTAEIGVNINLGSTRMNLRTVFALILHFNSLLIELYHQPTLERIRGQIEQREVPPTD
jgi:hypothetical protein